MNFIIILVILTILKYYSRTEEKYLSAITLFNSSDYDSTTRNAN